MPVPRQETVEHILINLNSRLDQCLLCAEAANNLPALWVNFRYPFKLSITPGTDDPLVLVRNDGREYRTVTKIDLVCHLNGCTNPACVSFKNRTRHPTDDVRAMVNSFDFKAFEKAFPENENPVTERPDITDTEMRLTERNNPSHFVEVNLTFKTFHRSDKYEYDTWELIRINYDDVHLGTNSILGAYNAYVFYKGNTCTLVARGKGPEAEDLMFDCVSTNKHIEYFKSLSLSEYTRVYVPRDFSMFRICKETPKMSYNNHAYLQFKKHRPANLKAATPDNGTD